MKSANARRLIVGAGLAAVNHGLLQQAWEIHAALPQLIADPVLRHPLEAIMLIGLGRSEHAANLAEKIPGNAGQLLQQVLTGQTDASETPRTDNTVRAISPFLHF